MAPKRPARRAASSTGGVPMESLVRSGEVPALLDHARDLYNSALAAHDETALTEDEEIRAAFNALRRALVFTATARGFLDGNVVG